MTSSLRLRLGSTLLLVVAFMLLDAPVLAQTPATAVAPAKYKAAFHVTDDDPRKWAQVLNNAKYTQDEMGARNVEIVVVMNGGGIGMLKLESPVAQKIEDAKKAGIHFHVCQNTMATQKLTKDDMLPEADYVTSGIGDVIKLQSQGWSYVKN